MRPSESTLLSQRPIFFYRIREFSECHLLSLSLFVSLFFLSPQSFSLIVLPLPTYSNVYQTCVLRTPSANQQPQIHSPPLFSWRVVNGVSSKWNEMHKRHGSGDLHTTVFATPRNALRSRELDGSSAAGVVKIKLRLGEQPRSSVHAEHPEIYPRLHSNYED